MEITLIRHGKSLWVENKPITCQEFKNWVEKYDCHGVFEEKTYPPNTLEKLDQATMIVTSDLKRAIESANYLNPHLPTISDPIFREIELPTPLAKFGGLKLHANIWAVMLRVLWFCGYTRGCESLKDATKRAEKAATFLIQCANEHHYVVLVGHGFFNNLIGKQFKKLEWKGRHQTSSAHWAATTYSFNQHV
ncbi:histidine phosphatase family protein [Niallia sp. Krafla_26]|uniref:histidine phosphatase family protein n=1 Tax=Niallia sp. Krafla_26 TaxID=3064703 RepID=UPI003D16F444